MENKKSFLGYASLLIGLIPQGLTEAAITATLPEMSKSLGISGEFGAQMTLGMGALGLMLGALLSGNVLGRFGTRTTLMFAIVAFGLAGGAGMIIQNEWLLYISRVIVGFASSCIATSCLWAINAQFAGKQKARLFGISGALAGIGVMAGVIIGGVIAQKSGWRGSFIVYPAFAIIALPLVLGGMKQIFPDKSKVEPQNYFAQLLPTYGMVLGFFMLVGMISMQLSFLLNDLGATDSAGRSPIQALPALTAIIGAFSFGILQSKLGASRIFNVFLACMGIGLLLLGSSKSGLILPALGAAIAGLSFGMSSPYFYHAVSEQTDVTSAGRYIGFVNAFTFMATFVNPFVFNPLKSAIGIHGLFYVGAALVVLIGIINIFSTKKNPTSGKSADAVRGL